MARPPARRPSGYTCGYVIGCMRSGASASPPSNPPSASFPRPGRWTMRRIAIIACSTWWRWRCCRAMCGRSITTTPSMPPTRCATACGSERRWWRSRGTVANTWRRTSARSPTPCRCSSRTAVAASGSRWRIRWAIADGAPKACRCWKTSSAAPWRRAFAHRAATGCWRCVVTWRAGRCRSSWRPGWPEAKADRCGLPAVADLLEAALDAHFHQDLGGNLLHREMRGVEERDVLALEQLLHLAHLELALGEAGVAAVGLALVADGGEPVRVDGQAEQLLLVHLEGVGQLQPFHVLFGQWVVGGADAVLHGHVQAGWRLAAARHAHQDQVGLVVVVGTGAVVVVEGEVHRLDALHVVGGVPDGVGLAHRIGRAGGQFLFQRREETGK